MQSTETKKLLKLRHSGDVNHVSDPLIAKTMVTANHGNTSHFGGLPALGKGNVNFSKAREKKARLAFCLFITFLFIGPRSL